MSEEDWRVSNRLFAVLQGGVRSAMLYISSLPEEEREKGKKEFKKRLLQKETGFIYRLRKAEGIKWSFHVRDYHVGYVREMVAGSSLPDSLRLYVYISNPLWHGRYRPGLTNFNKEWPFVNMWIKTGFMWDNIENQHICIGGEISQGWGPGTVGIVIKAFSCKERKIEVNPTMVIRGEIEPKKWCGDCWNLMCLKYSPPQTLQRLAMLACGRRAEDWRGCCNQRFVSPYRTPCDLEVVQRKPSWSLLWTGEL
uniref:Virus infectivity factor n=1 Tax=Feline immunodeficiency virus TaxID=11673 RepID=A0A1S7IWY0_9RETR|nr:virus infectivity factor [Feline immunodeficiency virus]